MAKSKKDVKNIEVKETVTVNPVKKAPLTKSYPLKIRLKVSGSWKEVGDSIKLTESQYRDFRSKKIV